MKNLIAILALIMVSQAQAEPKAVLIDDRTGEIVEVKPTVEQKPQVQVQSSSEAAQSAPIYILNNQKLQGYQGATATQAQVQEQPVSVVQDAPLKVSPADTVRKQRRGAEEATEDGIVQALEKARLEDEVRRRDRFNSALAPAPIAEQTATVVQTQQIQKIEAVQVGSAGDIGKVVIKEEKETIEPVEKVDIKSEVRAALDEREAAHKPVARNHNYVSGLIGMGAYPDVVNVQGNGAAGFAVGMVTPDGLVAEGSFLYGSYDVERLWNPYNVTTMRQYNLSAAVKYQFLPGRIRPNVGAVGSYTRRSFSVPQADSFATSDAIDAGLVAGLDFLLTETLSIGLDARYYWNIGSRRNNDNSYVTYSPQSNPIESLQYYTATAAAKFQF